MCMGECAWGGKCASMWVSVWEMSASEHVWVWCAGVWVWVSTCEWEWEWACVRCDVQVCECKWVSMCVRVWERWEHVSKSVCKDYECVRAWILQDTTTYTTLQCYHIWCWLAAQWHVLWARKNATRITSQDNHLGLPDIHKEGCMARNDTCKHSVCLLSALKETKICITHISTHTSWR